MNLGALRSSMELTLHTRHAARIWEGRAATKERVGIIGLGTFVAIMAKIRRGAEQDDTYSDWWMLRIEGKLDEAKLRLQELREQADQLLADIPPALTKRYRFSGTRRDDHAANDAAAGAARGVGSTPARCP